MTFRIFQTFASGQVRVIAAVTGPEIDFIELEIFGSWTATSLAFSLASIFHVPSLPKSWSCPNPTLQILKTWFEVLPSNP